MTFTLGYTPEKFKLVLAAGADFFSALTRSDGQPWPVGSELILDFAGAAPSWTATLSGATATWDVDQADVDALIAARPRKVRLFYVDGEARLLWAVGALDVKT